jgi:hypothetical protein
MTDQTPNPGSPKRPRCRHFTDHGRRCQLPVVDTRSGFCFRHAKPQPAPSDSVDFSAELIGELTDFESAVAINKFLTNLLGLVSKGRISPRRAAVLAYITNQLLHTHRAIDYDDDRHSGDDKVTIIMDVPRPDRSQDEDHSSAIQRT